MRDKVRMLPNQPTPNRAVDFNPDICNGCNRCAEICRNDVLMPNPNKGRPPIVVYPDECWNCGCCVQECHRPGAIEMLHPLNQSIAVVWKRRTTGEEFRLGMKDSPAPNTRPPAG